MIKVKKVADKVTSKKAPESSNGALKAAGIAGILGVAAAAAAGTYFLYGSKDAKKNRQKVQGWMFKAKGEVMDKLEKLKEVDEEIYNKVVDTVLSKYNQAKSIDAGDVQVMAADLKKHWKSIKASLSPKKVVKKAAKKAGK